MSTVVKITFIVGIVSGSPPQCSGTRQSTLLDYNIIIITSIVGVRVNVVAVEIVVVLTYY